MIRSLYSRGNKSSTPTDNRCQPVAKNIPKRKGSGPSRYRPTATNKITKKLNFISILFDAIEAKNRQMTKDKASKKGDM